MGQVYSSVSYICNWFVWQHNIHNGVLLQWGVWVYWGPNHLKGTCAVLWGKN